MASVQLKVRKTFPKMLTILGIAATKKSVGRVINLLTLLRSYWIVGVSQSGMSDQ